MADSEYERFVNGEVNAFGLDFEAAPLGSVEVRDDGDSICYTKWGGWHWQAEGGDRSAALRRLESRLDRLNPFDGFDTDWGDPGHTAGDFDEAIPEGMRALMEEWNRENERRETELLDIANDLVHRSRQFERRS